MLGRLLTVYGALNRTFGFSIKPLFTFWLYISFRTFATFTLWLDHLFFPGFKKVKLDRPVFIIGTPRSGTTFLHRFLEEHWSLACFQVWQMIMPSITGQKLLRPFIKPLARFNPALEEPDRPSWAHNYFSGVPAPAGAGLVLLPMILSFQAGDAFFREPAVVGAFLIVVSGLLVSRIPTYAFKSFRVPHQWVLPTMLFVGLLVASIVGAPWATLTAVIFVYIIGIPFAVRSYRGLQTKAEALLDRDDGEKDDDGEAAGG